MQQQILFITIIVVACYLNCIKSVAHTEVFRLKICEIIKRRNAPVNIVYPVTLGKRINEENWFKFYDCLAQQPYLVRDLQNFPQEPSRMTSSVSIYFIDSFRTLKRVVEFLNPRQKWKPGQCYVFIWLISDTQALQRFFEKVWHKQILNVITAVVSIRKIYTYEPFTAKGFQVKPLNNYPYFYDKLKNFHRFELKISMFKDSVRAVPLEDFSTNGYKKIDGWLARTLVERLNATARYISPTDNETYGALLNGTFSGALKDIALGYTHIGFNYRYTLDHVKPHIEELYPYRKRLLYLIVPAAKMRPDYLIFANAFTYSLWLLLLLNFLFVLLIFFVLQKLVERLPSQGQQHSTKHWRWYELVEMFVKTQWGEPVEGFSRISSLRQFLITWILFSYVLTTIYFAKLESGFVQPTYEPELDNLKDLPQLKAPIYAYDVVFEAIQVSLDPRHFQYINNRGIRVSRNISSDDFALAMVRKYKNVALIIHDELAREIVANTYDAETKRSTFHIVKEYLRSLTSSYVLTKGSPFIHKFQSLISAFFEHGLILHWLEVDAQQKSFLQSGEDSSTQHLENDFDFGDVDESMATIQKNVVLNLEVLQGAFYIWVAGIALSLIGFAVEYLFWRYKKRKERRAVYKCQA